MLNLWSICYTFQLIFRSFCKILAGCGQGQRNNLELPFFRNIPYRRYCRTWHYKHKSLYKTYLRIFIVMAAKTCNECGKKLNEKQRLYSKTCIECDSYISKACLDCCDWFEYAHDHLGHWLTLCQWELACANIKITSKFKSARTGILSANTMVFGLFIYHLIK